jgi:localization factor PodJL
MKPGIPWSVKGIEPDLREAAKEAARRSGMTLGEWLNAAIVEQAESEPESQHRTPPATTPKATRSRISTHPIDRAATRLEDIAEQLARIAQREGDTTVARHMPQEDNSVLARVLGRIESNERQTVEAFSAVNDRLSVLGRQFAKIQTAQKTDDSGNYQTLEKAVRNIVEHLEVSEKRTRESLKALQDRMTDMSQRASGAGYENILQQAPAFNQLESRLSELAKRVETVHQPVTQVPNNLRDELDGLAARIEDVRSAAEALAGKAQTQAVQQAQQELRSIEGRILGVMREAQATIASQSAGPGEIARLRSEIELLHTRVDEAQKSAPTDHDILALRQVVEQLSTRVAQGQDARPFAEMDRKIGDIARRLDQTQAATRDLPQFNEMDRKIVDISRRLEQTQAATRDLPQFNELEHRMAELDHRLNEAIRLQGQGPAREQLEQKLAEVDDRLGRTEHQLKHLETLERAINQLYDSLEHSRTHATQVAEEAANRMAQSIMAQAPQSVSPAGSPEIMALEQGLQAVREASQSADARNQETLEAVHETLEQIVNKLAELETAAIGQRVAQATAQPAPAVEAPLVAPAESPSVFASAAPLVTPAASEHEQPQVNPFEAPITGLSQGPVANDPFAAPGEPTISPNEDFIALARRVAQSATNSNGTIGTSAFDVSRKPKKPASKLSSFNLPFLSKKAKPEAAGAAAAAAGQLPPIKPATAGAANATNRRKLALMGLVLLALVAGVSVNMLGRMRNAAPPADPTPISAPADPAPAPQAEQKPADAAAPAAAADVAPAAQAPAAVAPQGSSPPPPVVTPAPLVTDPKAPAAVPQQQGFNVDTNQADPIMTGALPPAGANVASATDTALESTIGSAQLRNAATSGDAQAQFVVATRYLNGENVKQDFAKAAYWYGKAAAAGLAPAQYRVATLYERGKGVNLDLKTAAAWYEQAASLGNVKAMHNAAVLATGNGSGAPDYSKAYAWFSRAAAHGLKDSQYNLAVLIERGLGTKADAAQAYFWYLAAAAQGDTDAQTRADQLAKSLPPAIVTATKARLQKWVPEKASDPANLVSGDESKWQAKTGPRVQQGAAEPKNMINSAQGLLEKLGYNIGPHDGKLEGKTANAVRLFQLQKGLPVNGKITPELLDALQSAVS